MILRDYGHVFGMDPDKNGGEEGIRTPDTVARMPHFECGAFNHSATSPRRGAHQYAGAVITIQGRRDKNVFRPPA